MSRNGECRQLYSRIVFVGHRGRGGMKRRLRKNAFLERWGKALALGVLGLAISNPAAIAAPGPLGPPIGGSLRPSTVKPKPKVQPKPAAEAPPVQAPIPVQRGMTRPTGGYGQPVGGLDTSADRDTTMFGKAEDSYGIEMSLWPEDMEVSQGLLQWRVNIVRFSPLVSEIYRTPVRQDGFVTGIGKVSATMVLNQDGTCTSVLNLASNPVARIQVACSRGPGFMFRVLKPPRTTRWIAIAAVFRETEGMPTVVREYLVDMRTKAVWPVTDFSTEGFVVGECSGEAKILWNSDAARRLGLRVNDCLRTDFWPSDDGRLAGRPQPYEQAAARPQNPAPVRPAPTPRPEVAQAPAEETAAWIRSYRDSYLSGETNASAKSLARVRDLPTSDGSRVLRELSQGDSAKGRWVQGRDPTTRWLKLSDTNGYVWEGNLQEYGIVQYGPVQGPIRPQPLPSSLSQLLSRISGLDIRPGLKAVLKETVEKYGSTSDFSVISENLRYAELANAAYSDAPNVKGWEDISSLFPDYTASMTGFRAFVFQNKSEVVISFRGTDTARDWATNLTLGEGQLLQAAKLYVATQTYCQCKVTLTGHSLGGGLAQVIAASSRTKGVAFDPAPFAAAISKLPKSAFSNVISFRNSNDPLTMVSGGLTVGKMITVKNTAEISTFQSVALGTSFNHKMDFLFMAMQAVDLTNRTLIEQGLVLP